MQQNDAALQLRLSYAANMNRPSRIDSFRDLIAWRKSLYELDTLVDISHEIGYVDTPTMIAVNLQIAEIGRMLTTMGHRRSIH